MAKIVDKLDNINRTLEKMLDVMAKPEHPVKRALEIALMFAGIFSIVTSIDIMFNWF